MTRPARFCHHCRELSHETVCFFCDQPTVVAADVDEHDCAILGSCPICDSYDPLTDKRVREFLALCAKDAAEHLIDEPLSELWSPEGWTDVRGDPFLRRVA